jgi:hypothetical protein
VNISFAWTSPALVLGHKTCTRRDWDPGYASRMKRGAVLSAWDRQPRFHGNHIAFIRLLSDATWTPMSEMPDSDYQAEGFEFMYSHPEIMTKTIEGLPRDHFITHVLSKEGFENWRGNSGSMYVVRFEVLQLTPLGERLRAFYEQMMLATREANLCQ